MQQQKQAQHELKSDSNQMELMHLLDFLATGGT